MSTTIIGTSDDRIASEIVVLAVPYSAAGDIVGSEYASALKLHW